MDGFMPEADLGEPCAQMLTYDFDNDGDADVVSSSAHAYGVWWYEQVFDKDKKSSFITHTIDSTFSESHSLVLEDVNRDGLPDLITGKRFFAHQGSGPGGMEPAFIYWFELLKDGKGKPVWVKHLIDDNSGVGIQSGLKWSGVESAPSRPQSLSNLEIWLHP